jgi:hypothetical protein
MTKKSPNWLDLAELWLATHYPGSYAAVLFHPLTDPTEVPKKWSLLQGLGIDPTEVIGANFFVIPQESLEDANNVCNSIPQNLMFAMVWDGRSFTHNRG